MGVIRLLLGEYKLCPSGGWQNVFDLSYENVLSPTSSFCYLHLSLLFAIYILLYQESSGSRNIFSIPLLHNAKVIYAAEVHVVALDKNLEVSYYSITKNTTASEKQIKHYTLSLLF